MSGSVDSNMTGKVILPLTRSNHRAEPFGWNWIALHTALAFYCDVDTTLGTRGAGWGNRFPIVVFLSDVVTSQHLTVYVLKTHVLAYRDTPGIVCVLYFRLHLDSCLSTQHHSVSSLLTLWTYCISINQHTDTGVFKSHIHDSMRLSLFITTVLAAAAPLVASAPRYASFCLFSVL